MRKIASTFIAMCIFYSISAQQDTTLNWEVKSEKQIMIYRTWITLNNSAKKLTGVMYEIKDSAILVSNSMVRNNYLKGNFKVSEINYNTIDLVKIRSKYSIGKGALSGGIFGFALGGILGLIFSQDIFTPIPVGEKIMTGGISLGIGGALLGAVIGSMQITIPINGNIENFNKNKAQLKKYTIQ
ncbi:MAG: hypothetical protein WCO13_06880 [Bacteroidota bacterium]